MKSAKFLQFSRSKRGAALIIVLFFVVLLTSLIIVFLSRSMNAIQMSGASSSEIKSTILAESASDTIIGDLKQEIIAGSSGNVGTTSYPVFTPTSNLTMKPFMSGVPMIGNPATNAIPNLISRSVSPANTGGAAPYVPYPVSLYASASAPLNRAANDPSAANYSSSKVNSTAPSLNGRYVSIAQWNSHYLIPRNASAPIGSTNSDSTPITNFVPPDWVIVTRTGANSVSWNTKLVDSILTNSNYAIGRYAYAIYNEGGLLDMNIAGFPADPNPIASTNPPFNTQGPNGLTTAQISQKGSLALADLTQLSAGAIKLTQNQINNIVGWRNYASAGLTKSNGSFGNFSFNATTSSNWMTNFVLGNTNGYMQIIPPSSGTITPPTDQAFLSRQQLIGLTKSLGISPDFLQYMGTFSRALEQPSTTPDPNRPKILSNGNPVPAAGASQENTYIGNNDGEEGDTDPLGINPSFLSIRAESAFTRFNGATAVKGEPLVKTKFALSQLTMVAYNATNATAKAKYATAADPDPIYDHFGLSRGSASAPWTYNHGKNSIMTLSQVAATGREPDFAELLKAAIIAGSLAKGGPNILTTLPGNNYQYTLDTSLDTNVLQIMANLIDQQDTDSYPTVIQVQLNSSSRTVYGVEDLPYFYRYHLFSVVNSLPSTILSNSAGTTFPGNKSTIGTTSTALDYTNPSASPTTSTWSFSNGSASATVNAMQLGSVSGTAAGEATLFIVPDLWNPHDQDTLTSEVPQLRPNQFRIYAITNDPLSTPPLGQWNVGAIAQPAGSGYFPSPPQPIYSSVPFTTVLPSNNGNIYNWPISDPKPFMIPTTYNSIGNNIMYFSDGGSSQSTMGTLFREPTLLWNASVPGIGLAPANSPHVTDANNPSNTYYGIIAGRTPVQMQIVVASTPPNLPPTGKDGTYIVQANSLDLLIDRPVGTFPQMSFFLQYQDPNDPQNWITYDVKYIDFNGHATPSMVVNKATDYASNYQNVLKTGQFTIQGSCMDPRAARWGVANGGFLGQVSPGTFGQQNPPTTTSYVLEPIANANFNKPALGSFSVLETDRPRGDKGNIMLYSNPCSTSSATGRNIQMHWCSGATYFASSGDPKANSSPLEFIGLFSQNNPALLLNSKSGASQTPNQQNYVEDADGVARLAMGAYASTTLTDSLATPSSLAQPPSIDPNRIGLPEATASILSNTAVASPTAQTQSRPIILNRPFRSVSDMSYSFRGTPWKNIDFFTPASGDSALLDTFCINLPPANAIIAGRVDLNTRQIPVLQAVIAGAYRDEYNNINMPPSYAMPPVSGAEAANVAAKLVGITSDTTHAWRGPLENMGSLVGRFIANPGNTTGYNDFYTYTPLKADTAHGQSSSITYAGLSAALDSTVYTNATNSASASTPLIQRFRESGIRPLIDAGQVRVWNLLIDIIAQTGRYPKTATGFDQFIVTGQTHLWVHVALDRYTGEILDKQVEVITP